MRLGSETWNTFSGSAILAAIMLTTPVVADALAEADRRIVETRGTIVITRDRDWDIDFDVLSPPKGADLAWESMPRASLDWPYGDDSLLTVKRMNDTPFIFQPEMGTRIVRVEKHAYEELDYGTISRMNIFRKLVPSRVLPPGTVLAMRTSEGALAKLRVAGYHARRSDADTLDPDFGIELEWTLYQDADKIKPPDPIVQRARLSQAIREDNAERVSQLVSAHPELLTMPYAFFATPLHEAARESSANVVRTLIEVGADVNACAPHADDSLHNVPPLFEAVRLRGYENAKVLCEHGADVNFELFDRSLLVRAVRAGEPELVELLLEYGAELPKTRKHRKVLEEAFQRGASLSAHANRPERTQAYEDTRRVLEEHGYKF